MARLAEIRNTLLTLKKQLSCALAPDMPFVGAMRLNLDCQRMKSRSWWLVAGLLALATLLAGCASLAARGLLPEVQGRRPPDVTLGPELVLLDEPPALTTSLIDRDGRAHLFVTDGKQQLRHIEVLGDTVVNSEILARTDTGGRAAIDTVEQPAGKLRVLIGDKQYVRPAPDQQWQEIKGNPCQRFLPINNDLFCAFVVKGEEIGAPKRTDYYGGILLIVPFFFWVNTQATKLVIAQEAEPETSGNTWTIRAVVDPETPEDALGDFMVGTHSQGTIEFLYYVSRGGGAILVGCGGYSCGELHSTPDSSLRYAQVARNQLVPQAPDSQGQGSNPAGARTSWFSVQGRPLPMMPSMGGDWKGSFSRHRSWGLSPLQRRFTVNSPSGDIGGLLGGEMSMSGVGDTRRFKVGCCEFLWVELGIRDGIWLPGVDVVAAKHLPDATYSWFGDEHALIRSDSKGNSYALLKMLQPGIWKRTDFPAYFAKSGGNWSAPLILGRFSFWSSSRELAVSESTSAFAAWVNEQGKFVGRWIRPRGGP